MKMENVNTETAPAWLVKAANGGGSVESVDSIDEIRGRCARGELTWLDWAYDCGQSSWRLIAEVLVEETPPLVLGQEQWVVARIRPGGAPILDGPFARENVKALLRAGQLTFQDLAWSTNENRWCPITELTAFANLSVLDASLEPAADEIGEEMVTLTDLSPSPNACTVAAPQPSDTLFKLQPEPADELLRSVVRQSTTSSQAERTRAGAFLRGLQNAVRGVLRAPLTAGGVAEDARHAALEVSAPKMIPEIIPGLVGEPGVEASESSLELETVPTEASGEDLVAPPEWMKYLTR